MEKEQNSYYDWLLLSTARCSGGSMLVKTVQNENCHSVRCLKIAKLNEEIVMEWQVQNTV